MPAPGLPVKPPSAETAPASAPASAFEQLSAATGFNVMTAVLVLLTIAALYFGQDIFIPFALAVLLSFLLAPPVAWLKRMRVPRVAAVVLVVTAAVVMIAGVSVLVGHQVVRLANNLPTYQKTMQNKIRAIRAAAPGGGAIDRTTAVVQALGRELSAAAPQSSSAAGKLSKGKNTGEPVPVRVEPPEQDALTMARNLIGPLLGPIGTAGLVIIFIFFVLLEPSDLRDRFIRLAGTDLHRTTEALSEAASRVSRYLLMQLVVNASYGLPLGIGLYLIGVPGAFLWALLATLLRFIPYLGPVIAAFFPLTLAFAVDPGWHMLLWTAALIVTIELISNNVIEPWLYGSSTGMTPVAVILSAIFWTLLWGPVGLILATPLTVCLVVMGRYVPQLTFLDVLLGSDPVLSPEERLYQRLLAGNIEEALEIAEAEAAEASLLDFYAGVGMPALCLAENARERGASREDRKKVADGIDTVVQDLKDVAERQTEEQAQPQMQPPEHWMGAKVKCIAGRGVLDGAACSMLVHVMQTRGIDAEAMPATAVAPDAIAELDLRGVDVICLSYFNPQPKAYARFVCRRLKRNYPRLRIVLGMWNLAAEAGPAEQIAAGAGAEAGVTTLEQAVQAVEDMIRQTALPAMQPPPLPEKEEARLAALQASGILEPRRAAHLDSVARKVADAFEAPVALVSLIDESCQLWKGAAGLPEELDKSRQGTRDTSVCGHVVAAGKPLVVEDTARDPRFADNPFLRRYAIRSYAGVPLRTASGHVIGSLCVIDNKPRTLSPRELKLLQLIADELMTELESEKKPLSAEPADALAFGQHAPRPA